MLRAEEFLNADLLLDRIQRFDLLQCLGGAGWLRGKRLEERSTAVSPASRVINTGLFGVLFIARESDFLVLFVGELGVSLGVNPLGGAVVDDPVGLQDAVPFLLIVVALYIWGDRLPSRGSVDSASPFRLMCKSITSICSKAARSIRSSGCCSCSQLESSSSP